MICTAAPGQLPRFLQDVSKKVIGVEIVEEAVEAARENAVLNHLDNCEFIAGDVLKVLDDVEEKPDFIVLDPPRDGIHPKALEKLFIIRCRRWSIFPASRPALLEIWRLCSPAVTGWSGAVRRHVPGDCSC